MTMSAPPVSQSRRRSVCILSRKPLENITRVTRMAKVLVDGGFDVTVVSLQSPVRDLRELCSEVNYIDVRPQPVTSRLIQFVNRSALTARNRHARSDRRIARAAARGGMRATAGRARSAISKCLDFAVLAQRAAIAGMLSPLLKQSGVPLRHAWADLSRKPASQMTQELVRSLQQWAMTRAFAVSASDALVGRRFDVVQAHDNLALRAAAKIAAKSNAKLIYDAVELTSHRLATNFNVLETICENRERRGEARIFRRADAMLTVSEGLADWYSREHRIKRPLVVRNCQYYWPFRRDPRLRADAGVGSSTPLIIWFGRAYPEQGLEILLESMACMKSEIHAAIVAWALPRWKTYVEEILPRRAAELGIASRVHFLPPRDPTDLVAYASGADIGIIPRPTNHLNNYYSMPNKFMEMMMARLPVAASKLHDIGQLITQFQVGAIFDEDDPAHIVWTIENMLKPDNLESYRANVMRAAEELTWEKESMAYARLVASLASPGEIHPERN